MSLDNNKKKLAVSFWIVVLTFILAVSSAFAWMSIAGTLKVTDLSLNVVTENFLEIAPDVDGEAGEYTTVLNMSELLDDDTALKPVTYNSATKQFLCAGYGVDGRIAGLQPISVEDEPNYIYKLDFWIRTGGANCTVKLIPPSEVTQDVLGGGTYVVGKTEWDSQSISNKDAGTGAQRAMRVGFLSYATEDFDEDFVMYEPNASESANAYVPTPSYNGSANLVDSDKLILQGESKFSEQMPVLRDNVNYSLGQFFTEDTGVFSLRAGGERKVSMYIWLEGNDTDCNNTISAAKIFANIQFGADVGSREEQIVPR